MSDDCQSGLAHFRILLVQVLVEVFVVGLYDVGEAVQQVAHGDDDVVLDYGVGVGVVEESHHVRELLFAEVRAETHELAVGEHTDDLQLAASLEIEDDLLDDRDPTIDEGILDYLLSQ